MNGNDNSTYTNDKWVIERKYLGKYDTKEAVRKIIANHVASSNGIIGNVTPIMKRSD